MLIAGVDEAGRGPLAGPVVAAVAVFEEGYINHDIRDSKKLSAKKRDGLFDVIIRDCRAYAIVSVGARRIDAINIREATKVAMSLAVRRITADLVLVDGNMAIPTTIPQRTVIGGDDLHVEISAASILAKVWRDRIMIMLDNRYPGYGLATHAGYPTKAHREAVRVQGPSPIHRATFAGVREYLHLSTNNSRTNLAHSSVSHWKSC